MQPSACHQPCANKSDLLSFKLLHTWSNHVYSTGKSWHFQPGKAQIIPSPRKAVSNSLLSRNGQHSNALGLLQGTGYWSFVLIGTLHAGSLGEFKGYFKVPPIFPEVSSGNVNKQIFWFCHRYTTTKDTQELGGMGHQTHYMCFFDPSVRLLLSGYISYVHPIWCRIIER